MPQNITRQSVWGDVGCVAYTIHMSSQERIPGSYQVFGASIRPFHHMYIPVSPNIPIAQYPRSSRSVVYAMTIGIATPTTPPKMKESVCLFHMRILYQARSFSCAAKTFMKSRISFAPTSSLNSRSCRTANALSIAVVD